MAWSERERDPESFSKVLRVFEGERYALDLGSSKVLRFMLERPEGCDASTLNRPIRDSLWLASVSTPLLPERCARSRQQDSGAGGGASRHAAGTSRDWPGDPSAVVVRSPPCLASREPGCHRHSRSSCRGRRGQRCRRAGRVSRSRSTSLGVLGLPESASLSPLRDPRGIVSPAPWRFARLWQLRQVVRAVRSLANAAQPAVSLGISPVGEKHASGSRCLEGTRRVPRGYRPCCEAFARHTTSCAFDVRYEWWAKSRIWVTVIDASAGGGGIEISFCPHCGSRLVTTASGRRRSKAASLRK